MRSAFTLLEILISILIVSIILSIVIPASKNFFSGKISLAGFMLQEMSFRDEVLRVHWYIQTFYERRDPTKDFYILDGGKTLSFFVGFPSKTLSATVSFTNDTIRFEEETPQGPESLEIQLHKIENITFTRDGSSVYASYTGKERTVSLPIQ